MPLTLLLAALAMTAIVAARYLAVSGGFAWLTARRRPALADWPGRRVQVRREIGWSLVAAAIYAVPAAIALTLWQERGWTRLYDDWTRYGWAWLPASALVYLFVHDTWFYWTHRLMHRPWWFARVHAVHHQSRPPTAWAAMSFHPWESLSGAVLIPALLFVVPIHWAMLAVVMAVATFFGVTNHIGWELFPRRWLVGRFGRVLITASHHHLHHARYRCNYGLYFRFWDGLCGTDAGLAGELLDEEGDARALRRSGGVPAAGERAPA